MDRAAISPHLVRVWRFVRDAHRWVTSEEMSREAQVAPRTARAHAQHFVALGLFEQAALFPGHRYRIAKGAVTRHPSYVLRLLQAEAILSEDDPQEGPCNELR